MVTRARAAAAAVALAAGLTMAAGASPAAATAAPTADAQGYRMLVRTARFAPPTAFFGSAAKTYDRRLVPAGAGITVMERASGRHTQIQVRLNGLKPNRVYGMHVHTKPCGRTGEAAGPHYQNVADPVQPSVDPEYANRKNEVWLDTRTDRRGRAWAYAWQDWRFRTGGARSVVIHEHATSTAPGEAGTAGDRLACFTVPFV